MKNNRILSAAFVASSIAAVSLTGCYKGELYDIEVPGWTQDSISAVAARNALISDDVPGVLIDLVKDADAFEFHGGAEMLTKEILLIETGKGGKNGNFVSLKKDGWLKDKISFKDVATISFDAYPTVNGSDWNYVFGIGNTTASEVVTAGGAYAYFDGTIGFIQRVGDPNDNYYPGGAWVSGNKMGGTADDNPYNYFSGLNDANCNKWYHFDYVYSTAEVCIYVNGIKSVAHELTPEQGANIKAILAKLNEGQLVIGAGCDPNLENFGGYIANFTIRNVEYVKTSDFFSESVVPKESEIKSLTIEGPETVTFGTTYDNLLEQVKIKVTYEVDGEIREQDLTTSDVIATLIPDMSTVGKKTLSVYYNTTFAGKFQQNVKAELVFEVVPLEITTLKITTDLSAVDYCPGVAPTALCNLEVNGIQSNNEAITLDNATLTFSKVDADGKFTVSYKTADGKDLSVDGAFGGKKVFGVIVGKGEFINDSKFGTVFKNNTDNVAVRENYLLLPTDQINACASAGRVTISFWIKNYDKEIISEWSPVFMVKNGDVNSEWLYYIFRHKGQLLVNYAGWVDSPLSATWSAENDWLNGNDNWHYVVATVAANDLTLYVDGEVISTCTPDGGDGNSTTGFIDDLANINFFAIGGAQTNGWGDSDLPCMYSEVTVSSTVPNAADVKATYEAGK